MLNSSPDERDASVAPLSQPGVEKSLSTSFPAFPHQEELVTPYNEELNKDIGFQEQLNEQLLELMLEFHAWASSRPDIESATAGDILFEEMEGVLNTEREQETTRLRLLEFISRLKTALAALTGFNL